MALVLALFRLGVCVPIVCQIVFLTIPTGIANLMLHEQVRGYGSFEPDRAHQRAQLGKGLP